MSQLINQFHFIRPGYLLALLPLLLLFILLSRQTGQSQRWQQVCDAHLLPYLLETAQHTPSRWPLRLLATVWFISAIALAGPTWSRQPQPVYQSSLGRVFVLDLSNSMLARDIPPSRLVRAKYKLQDLLKQPYAGSTGLVVFADEPYVVSPLTQDSDTIIALLDELRPGIMPISGDNTAAGIQQAAKLLKQGGSPSGDIILITDSPATGGAITLAQELKTQKIYTSVLGIGTARGAPIQSDKGGFEKDAKGAIKISKFDPSSLKALARAGGGIYASFSQNNRDVTQLTREGNHQHSNMKHTKRTEQTSNQWLDQGYKFLLFLLPLAACGFRRGWLSENKS